MYTSETDRKYISCIPLKIVDDVRGHSLVITRELLISGGL